MRPNHALQRTGLGVLGCSHKVLVGQRPVCRSLSLALADQQCHDFIAFLVCLEVP